MKSDMQKRKSLDPKKCSKLNPVSRLLGLREKGYVVGILRKQA